MLLTKAQDSFEPAADDYAACIGCGVCMLSCPVWQQYRAQELTFCGRARLVMEKSDDELLARSAGACLLCGSCEALCPWGIPTQEATMRLRQRLARKTSANSAPVPAHAPRKTNAASNRIFLPGSAMRKNRLLVNRCMILLNRERGTVSCADDDGPEIAPGIETGGTIDHARLEGFLASLRGAKEIIASEGLMVNFLSRMLGPDVTVRGLGPALLDHQGVRDGVRPGDLYIIETRAYNAKRDVQAMFYETLRRESGCTLNLDLHRAAIPTGMMGRDLRAVPEQAVSAEAQVKWILEGRRVDRVVVEHPEDGQAFVKYSDLPVVHLAEAGEP